MDKTSDEIKDEGYRAQARGKHIVADNPYEHETAAYWLWREGFIEAFKDSH